MSTLSKARQYPNLICFWKPDKIFELLEIFMCFCPQIVSSVGKKMWPTVQLLWSIMKSLELYETISCETFKRFGKWKERFNQKVPLVQKLLLKAASNSWMLFVLKYEMVKLLWSVLYLMPKHILSVLLSDAFVIDPSHERNQLFRFCH